MRGCVLPARLRRYFEVGREEVTINGISYAPKGGVELVPLGKSEIEGLDYWSSWWRAGRVVFEVRHFPDRDRIPGHPTLEVVR